MEVQRSLLTAARLVAVLRTLMTSSLSLMWPLAAVSGGRLVWHIWQAVRRGRFSKVHTWWSELYSNIRVNRLYTTFTGTKSLNDDLLCHFNVRYLTLNIFGCTQQCWWSKKKKLPICHNNWGKGRYLILRQLCNSLTIDPAVVNELMTNRARRGKIWYVRTIWSYLLYFYDRAHINSNQ